MTDDLVKNLIVKAGVMETGERIAWGSDTALMREAASRIEALEAEVVQRKLEVAHANDTANVAIKKTRELLSDEKTRELLAENARLREALGTALERLEDQAAEIIRAKLKERTNDQEPM